MAETKRVDPLEGLEERLQSHSRAFESLLALTPAREYYGSHFVDGQDPSEQWNRKKQTKEQKRAAKKAKLDPANNKSALDVLKEHEAAALKRKRGEVGEDAEEKEEGVKRAKGEEDADAAEARRRQKAERKKEKRQLKKERKVAKREKAEARKARKQESVLAEVGKEQAGDGEDAMVEVAADIEPFDASGLAAEGGDAAELNDDADERASQSSSAPTTPLIDSPAFDVGTNHSAASSSSSIVPPSTVETAPIEPGLDPKQARPTISELDTKPAASPQPEPTTSISASQPHLPHLSAEEKHARLRARIEELRAARKADGPEVRSRQDLLEQRRKKDEQRKAHKKELRRKAKEDEVRRQEEQLRGSGSPLSADIFSPRSPLPTDTAYTFSRLAFEDGTSADVENGALKNAGKRKGPQDPKTALLAAQKKHSRLAGFGAEKRADIEEKDSWLNARKRAHGERVRDDTSLLKKALKRKEKQKSKSEEQWKERQDAVVKGREMKQKRRETNLAKRKEEKGGGGKKKGGSKGGKGAKKGGGKKRAGFEGSFKA